MPTVTPIRLHIVGPGRLGCSLASALAGSDRYLVAGVACYSEADRERARRWMPSAAQYPLDDPRELEQVDLVLLTLADGAIRPVAGGLAPHFRPHQVVLHTSGLLPASVLDGLGIPARLGSFHPLQTFADPRLAREQFAGCTIACEGELGAVQAAQELARHLEARVVTLPAGSKPAYHAAAVVASNYLVAITAIAARLLASAGIDPEQAIEMLGPLQRGTLDNLKTLGIPRALTGPVARGDFETVQSHLAAISRLAPELLPVYRQLGLVVLDLARRMAVDPPLLDRLGALFTSEC
ncbi:MAG: DUF2520 domain-containing protein [Bradymonadales bacterium]|nr:DUF2520 domain-containing protein [Bradymonadales bacterium]